LRRTLFLIVVILLLIAGGYLSLTISSQGAAAIPGLRVQTENPEANVLAVTPDKGALFFIFAMIALGSLVGMGLTLAIIFWLLNRGVRQAGREPNREFAFNLNAANPNSVGGLLTKYPSVTIAVVILLLISIAVFAAVAFGVFTPQ
jgi:hypothetical protein